MSEQLTSVKELVWLASYYERFDMPENAQLIKDALAQTQDSTDEWAPIRYIEAALEKSDDERLSA